MENGLHKLIEQNSLIIIGGFVSFVGILLTAILKLFFKYDTERNQRSEDRFKAGEDRFKRLETGQESIAEQIEKGQEKDEAHREEIKDSISELSNGLLILQTEHMNNHRGDK